MSRLIYTLLIYVTLFVYVPGVRIHENFTLITSKHALRLQSSSNISNTISVHLMAFSGSVLEVRLPFSLQKLTVFKIKCLEGTGAHRGVINVPFAIPSRASSQLGAQSLTCTTYDDQRQHTQPTHEPHFVGLLFLQYTQLHASLTVRAFVQQGTQHII